MNTFQLHLKQMNDLQRKLNKENKAYMKRLRTYMTLASGFYSQEERTVRLLVSIYQDVLEAQKDGQSAEDFLGKDSQQMADQLLSDLPPLRWYYGLRLTGSIALVYIGWLFLGTFSCTGYMKLEWRSLLCDLLIGFMLPSSAFFILKNLVYEPSKAKARFVIGIWSILVLGIIGLRIWLSRQFYEFIHLPFWVSVLILVGIAAGIWYYRKKTSIIHVFMPSYILTVLSGFSQLVATHFGYGERDWTGWLPLGFIGLALISSLLGALYMLKKDELS
ncbi:hypothetical protein [Streptococcus ruminantium]|uniref:hypothetical protein n=1 Tax=Streptococcus ruminantium TaxID=1917441 RepID=UPI001D13CF12|nr:hypothetical protein [Streptococcus ruminantium]